MGNCCIKCTKCCGEIDKRTYLRTRYNVEQELSVEFDNLMDDDMEHTESAQYGSLLTDQERKMLLERKFTDLIEYQRQVDAEIEAELIEQEEQLRRDEEAFYEAKRQAACVASQLRSEEQRKHAALASRSRAPVDEWEIANGEEDFEQFLENVRVRSLTARTRAVTSQVVHIDTPGSGSNSSKDESVTSPTASFRLLDVSQ